MCLLRPCNKITRFRCLIFFSFRLLFFACLIYLDSDSEGRQKRRESVTCSKRLLNILYLMNMTSNATSSHFLLRWSQLILMFQTMFEPRELHKLTQGDGAVHLVAWHFDFSDKLRTEECITWRKMNNISYIRWFMSMFAFRSITKLSTHQRLWFYPVFLPSSCFTFTLFVHFTPVTSQHYST